MENRKAPSMKSTVLYWIAFTVALALVAVGLLNLAVPVGPTDSTAPEAAQSAPVATQAAPVPTASPVNASQSPGAGNYTLKGAFLLFGSQVAGESSFRPSDLVSGDCRLTEGGKKAQSMTLIQDVGPQTELSNELMNVYVNGSAVYLSNARFVAGENPYIVADSRIVPHGAVAPFPAYVEAKQARFRWALPAMVNADGQSVGDPLIVCNYV